ncbi:GntR family transcriptional regulator [Paenibacillus typhae]|uniref:Transcriptional regulator, GntR family n=1 Tax=Paenibacillus typhae TaxID=1174501 RepID=A0A1G9AXU4_9BACL|nr:GntR family transcriptional regulator [Paenibacillus typhae]SDK32018.1 transcriptional regulator, GntR family [Paenibacillus typhae]
MKESGSLIDTAYAYLRNQIIHGEIMPGTMLSENDLALQLGMSRTPVRIAISRLESAGIVQSLKKRGVLVKEVSYQESAELAEIMLAMQLYASTIIEQEGFRELAQLRGHYEQQLEATQNGDYITYIQAAMDFGYCLISSVRSKSMLQSLETVQSKIQLIAIMNFRMTPLEPHFSATPLNGSILEALEKKDYGELRNVLLSTSARIRQNRSFY